ncbi:MAG: hypothetical protein UT39_C0009G0018 [Candidatus Woesebacteria bacterium GW2011_GWA1_39_21]|uniref:Uncharacterized protein n=1 Tax=Candidatus Woesebacteria bacterium GW2011_GWA1_39_21 TaxID=1618550 RepID=A0A0G0N742_9BACT|nr:MAG: hypothetical protein UT39_C0009G0018 [Candidatus Woesebacteria bacterium GW2011_GWA1_39_21]
MDKLLATAWGTIDAPPGVSRWGALITGTGSGPQKFFTMVVRTMIVVAGIYAFINIILAGYDFMSAGGNPEKMARAWQKIWQTLLGLLIAAGSFILAAIFGWLIFGNPNALLQITIFTP